MDDREVLLRALKRANLTPESYSGRFMFGSKCISVIVHNMSEVPAKHRKTASSETLGMDIVVYWTWASWEKE